LFVNGLKLDEPKPVTVSLDIDGYSRAMMFEIGNSQTGENKKVEVYVRAEETLMAPGKPFRVFFEPYLITRSDWKLNRVLTAKSGTPLSEMLKKGSTLYDQSVTVTAAEDGSLALSTAHADWSVSIPTAGLAGKFNYQAELLNDGGEKKSSNSVTVTVDPSKPEGVSLDEIPNDKWIAGTALSLSAKGNDSLSGIAKVWFYVGDPPTAEGKGATVVAGIKLSDGVYQAERPILLPEQKGDVRVGVLMVNGVGMTAGAEKTLTVRIPPGEKKDGSGKTTGTITGKVVFGYLGKSNLPVELQDASGKAVKTATSAADGTFKFEDVLPGSYTVTSTNKADHNAKGEAKTSVEAGKTSTVEVRLKR
jgi:hypothetical protein